MSNTFGHIFRFTSFGESHGKAVGGIIDGCPTGLVVDMEWIDRELLRRRTGTDTLTSARQEKDELEFLSGIFEGRTTGTPIAFLIRNRDSNSADYDCLKDVFRPSHADYTYFKKFGIRDYRGGGRASARETAARVVAGAIAKMILHKNSIHITAYTSQVGPVCLPENFPLPDSDSFSEKPLCCPDNDTAEKMLTLLKELKSKGDTVGAMVNCFIRNVPAGLGNPVFGKLQAELASAIMSINAAKGFEYGLGFKSSAERGSVVNDVLIPTETNGMRMIRTGTNYSGGIQGGISNGEEIYFRVAFKPVPTLMQPQQTVNKKGDTVTLKPGGRHDVCVVPRVIPVVEAMAAIVLADQVLLNNSCRL